MKRNVSRLSLGLCWLLSLGTLTAGQKYTVTFEYDPAFKGGPNKGGPKMNWGGWTKYLNLEEFDTATAWIELPSSLERGDVIRGVMPSNIRNMGALREFAERNKIAIYESTYVHNPYGGPHKTFLREAAKVTGHPELEHAGAILQGNSNQGRYAAHFAHYWPERTLAVILDHSWTNGHPLKKAEDYNAGNTPMAEGVPYFFNASKDDAQGGINRRALHYQWCIKGFKEDHPCTSIISYESVPHRDPGDRSLQAVWLEDVLTLRLPAIIPADGTPYELIPIDPDKVGGHMSVKIVTEGNISHYTNVKVGPIGDVSSPSWWIPGAASAALTVEWLQKNKAVIKQDDSAKIKTQPAYVNLDATNTQLMTLLSSGNLNRTALAFERAPQPTDPYQAQVRQVLERTLSGEITTRLAILTHLRDCNDRYELRRQIMTMMPTFEGIAAFDEMFAAEKAKGELDPETLRIATGFYTIVDRLKARHSPADVNLLGKAYEVYPDTLYGQMSKELYETLRADPQHSYKLMEVRTKAFKRLQP